MSTTTSTHVYDNSSAANFKDWGKYISDAFTAAGWTYGSDSGQVAQDWSSNPAVPGTNTYVYQIWKMADTLQSTNPVYVKLEFGNSSSGSSNPGFRVTIGTGSNGSGTITGAAILGPIAMVANGNSTGSSGATAYNCYSSGDTGRIGLLMWRDHSNAQVPWVFAIERTLDASGSATADGVTLVNSGGQSSNGYVRQQTLLLTPSVALGNQYPAPMVLGGADDQGFSTGRSSDVTGTNVSTSPVFPDYGKFGNPMTVLGRACPNDITENTTITVTLYSATRTYLCAKNANCASAFGPGQNNGFHGLLFRYD